MLDQKFSRYEIREELGMGGMATVFRAYDPMFEREVAVKVLKRELLEDLQLRERFERETKIIAKLEHAAIVPVYDVGHDNNQLFYVMRYMSGGSLSERIQNGLTRDEIAHIILRLSAALDYAHNKGVVHRDLKPANILFDENNNPFISDFGIAKFAQAATKITHTGIIGTPRYISPEQARGDDADGRSDLYSLAVMLFEMLSGKTPFEATTPLAMAFKHATEEPPSILKINPDLPEGIENILDKALAKLPSDRYNTCLEFASAFFEVFPDSISSENDLITPPPPRARRLAEAITELPDKPPAPQPEPAPQTQVPSQPRPWMLGGLFALILILSIWGYRYFAAPPASTSTPETAAPTQTLAPPTTSPTATLTVTVPPTETLASTPQPSNSIIPGGADKFAIVGRYDIFLVDFESGDAEQLTNSNQPKTDLQWLPGGTELLYLEGKCAYRLDTSTSGAKPEKVVCLDEANFEGFRVSPDGKHVAISIKRRLLVVPFKMELFETVTSAFQLQGSPDLCLDYSEVAVKGAQWSADGRNLAILYQSALGQRLGDTLRVMKVDLQRCREVDPQILEEIPGRHFIPDGYETSPVLPSFYWDGNRYFLFNTLKRNLKYGELYLYDTSTRRETKLNPIEGVCCYGNAVLSPDGTHILLTFQDLRLGANSETQIYYIPLDQIGTEAVFTPVGLPLHFFPDPRVKVELALHPAVP